MDGILFEQLRERLAQLDVVLALLGGDRDAQHRRMGSDRGKRWMRLLAVGQGVAGLGVIELAECHRVAGLGGAALLAVLAHELEHRRDPSRVSVGAHAASYRLRSCR